MNVTRCASFFALAVSLIASSAHADSSSDVWTTGVLRPTDGAFGTPGSVTGNTLSATIDSGSSVATVSLTASNNLWFRTTGSPNITNDELAPFLENDAPLTSLTFSSNKTLDNFDMLVHNLWFSADGNQNFIGNFTVYHGDGTIVSNATPILRSLTDDSPFDVDFLGGTVQPTDINSVFDGSNLLTISSVGFDPGNGAPLSTYLYDGTQSIFSEEQGSGIISFDETLFGGIDRVDFTWVGKTVGANTAFIGIAGVSVAEPESVPEPSISILFSVGVLALTRRRNRRI